MERLKKNLILALGLGLVVYVALAMFIGLDKLERALDGFQWSLVPAILGLVALSYVGRYLRWNYYLKVLKIHIPHRLNVPIFAAGLSMAISPGKLGEVLKSVFVRRVTGVPIARTAPTVVAERATDGTGMVAWGMLGALTFSFGPGVLVLFLAVTVGGIVVLRSKRLSLLAERVLEKIPVLNKLAPHLSDFHGASSELLSLKSLAVGSVFSFFSWGLECTAVYLCSVGIGAGQPFLVVVFIFAVSSLLGVGSMLPGGIGAAEASLTGLFKFYAGLSAGMAVGLTFLIRLATLWFATLIGVGGLLLVRYMIGDVIPDEPADEAVEIPSDSGR